MKFPFRDLPLIPYANIRGIKEGFRLRPHLTNARLEIKAARLGRSLRHELGRKNRFVIYVRSRSGGTFLLDMLGSHPEIECESCGWDGEMMARHWFFPYRYAEIRAAQAKKPAYGFKAKPEELDFVQCIAATKFLRTMHRNGWKIIHLRRHNVLRQAISAEVAIATNVWHHRLDGQQPKGKWLDQKVFVDPQELLERIAFFDVRNEREDSDLAGLPYLSLNYEADLQRTETHNATANRIFAFLGLPPHDVQTSFVRTGSDDIFKNVENADEVRAAVSASPHAHFLDD